ncbi:MAG: hypothetical protein EXR79_04800 [Myxococcales bacterium]|nr:hypothetical protein [Myxococcales bacterium]
MPTPHRLLEIVAIAAFALLDVGLMARVAVAATTTASWCLVAVAVLTAYLVADFASGFVHWMFDRYFSVRTAIVGENFVKPFREHHVDPKGICRHDFVETNGNNCIGTVPILAAVHLLPLPPDDWLWLCVAAGTAAMMIFVFCTNQFHAWAHATRLPWYIARLQGAWLILNKRHHDIHHTAPFDRYYCITTGWLNPLLHRVRFFPLTERLIFQLTGVRAGRDDAAYAGLDPALYAAALRRAEVEEAEEALGREIPVGDGKAPQ